MMLEGLMASDMLIKKSGSKALAGYQCVYQ